MEWHWKYARALWPYRISWAHDDSMDSYMVKFVINLTDVDSITTQPFPSLMGEDENVEAHRRNSVIRYRQDGKAVVGQEDLDITEFLPKHESLSSLEWEVQQLI